IDLTLSGRIDPSKIITQHQHLTDALSAFKTFDKRKEGWIKVELLPQ
ncbi:glutathione-dependent formaldehyde dehydrogenase, partial [Pseudomonas zeshuii]|nr:glutathione-dependent formaldehyde dehydrogenase [Pseudomonas zeshuii]